MEVLAEAHELDVPVVDAQRAAHVEVVEGPAAFEVSGQIPVGERDLREPADERAERRGVERGEDDHVAIVGHRNPLLAVPRDRGHQLEGRALARPPGDVGEESSS